MLSDCSGRRYEHHTARTVLISTGAPDLTKLQQAIEESRADLERRIAAEGYPLDAIAISAAIDVRYAGQSSEITIPLASTSVDPAVLRDAEARFEAEFERTYGHRGDRKEFELVTFRLVATVARRIEHGNEWRADGAEHFDGTARRRAYFGPAHGTLDTPIFSRRALADGAHAGPLLVQEYDTDDRRAARGARVVRPVRKRRNRLRTPNQRPRRSKSRRGDAANVASWTSDNSVTSRSSHDWEA